MVVMKVFMVFIQVFSSMKMVAMKTQNVKVIIIITHEINLLVTSVNAINGVTIY